MRTLQHSFDTHFLSVLLPQLNQFQRFVIAYSGGLDSHVLLHAMAQLRDIHPEWDLQAIHIHHGLSSQADIWAEHAQQICEQLRVPFQCHQVLLERNTGESLEAQAREARYRVFAEILPTKTNLLTAHTQNDQAETILLQLLRGSGLPGLAAMPMQQDLGKGFLLRPFLSLTRQQLQDYAERHQLNWIHDESNDNLRFDRNYLRHRVIPLLQQRWPAYEKTLTRAAHHCAEGADLLKELAHQDLKKVIGPQKNSILLVPFSSLSSARQRNVMRYWIRSLGYSVPNSHQLQQIQIQAVQFQHSNHQMQVKWEGITLRRFQNQLVLLTDSFKWADLSMTALPWDLHSPLILPNRLGQLSVYKKRGQGLSPKIKSSLVNVRFRHGGERCHLPGRHHSHSLKKLLQAWGVPFWQRPFIPLLYVEDQLISVINFCICEGFSAADNEEGFVIQYQPPY